MRKFIYLLAFLFAGAVFSQERVDVYTKYGGARALLKEGNDCAVIAYAEAFDVSYYTSFQILSKYREKGKAIYLFDLMKVIGEADPCMKFAYGNGQFSALDVVNGLEDGDYLFVLPYHIFFLDKETKWRVHDDTVVMLVPYLLIIKINSDE